ncbi:glycosyltransferase family 4 protein [Flavobacterium myungsuense]|uniref:Glycosyltransferase family 4 protein n=1 Tax=Flavobacterium myungsuense TaxID=651823 RepID=A0ABW3IZF2_9FLAO
MNREKIIRITTVPISLEKLLSGQLRFMSSFYDVIAVAAEKDNLEKLGKNLDVPVFHLEMTRKITPIQDIIAVVKLFLFLKKTKPLIVHSHTPKAGIVGMLASKLAGVPYRLHTVAGLPLLEARGAKRKILDVVEKFTYACANRVYPNSFGLKEIIIENNFCKSSKLKVLANGSSNGIDTSYFNSELFSANQNLNLKNELGILPDDFVFIFVGRLVRDKGINEMVLAFVLLQKENAKIKLLLVGDYENDLDPLSSATVDRINTNDSIFAVGFKNDVRPYFAISDTLVFPSYREGFPNVVMQAGAMNLPCIVSDINGCNEIIIEKENGFIIPVKNDLAIFEAMKKILSNTLLTTKMKTNSRAMIVSRYEQKVVWDAILSEYRTFDPRL